MTDIAETIIEETVRRCQALHEYAGRPAWEQVIRDVMREHLEAPESDGWQPIETAPENVAILIHVPGLDYYGNNGVYAGMLVNMGTGRRWMTFGWAIGRDLGEEPDAWKPLPSPPGSE